MDHTSIVKPPVDSKGGFELGEILGSRRAFSAIAGRCSAADAACLQRMRDQKLYKQRAATWDEFCPKYLGMSKTAANRVIAYLEEFGPDYFELAQLTRIPPDRYRAIASAVKDKAIQWNGEAIALVPENYQRIAAAVEDLQKGAVPAPKTAAQPRGKRLASLKRTGEQLAAEIADLARSSASHKERTALWAARAEILNRLTEVDLAG